MLRYLRSFAALRCDATVTSPIVSRRALADTVRSRGTAVLTTSVSSASHGASCACQDEVSRDGRKMSDCRQVVSNVWRCRRLWSSTSSFLIVRLSCNPLVSSSYSKSHIAGLCRQAGIVQTPVSPLLRAVQEGGMQSQ